MLCLDLDERGGAASVLAGCRWAGLGWLMAPGCSLLHEKVLVDVCITNSAHLVVGTTSAKFSKFLALLQHWFGLPWIQL